MAPRPALIGAMTAMLTGFAASAQETRDVGLPPPFDVPALPPAVNPALPPPSGQRYLPGTGGPYGDPPQFNPPVPGHLTMGPESLRGEVRQSAPVRAEGRIERIRDVVPALRACWAPPSGFDPAARLDATIRFSLRRSGEIAGEPLVTYVNRRASAEQRRALVRSVKEALATCAPLALSPSLGAAIAGRPIAVRFIMDAPSPRADSRSLQPSDKP